MGRCRDPSHLIGVEFDSVESPQPTRDGLSSCAMKYCAVADPRQFHWGLTMRRFLVMVFILSCQHSVGANFRGLPCLQNPPPDANTITQPYLRSPPVRISGRVLKVEGLLPSKHPAVQIVRAVSIEAAAAFVPSIVLPVPYLRSEKFTLCCSPQWRNTCV